MNLDDLLHSFTKMCKEVLKDKLVGVYLHGSASMGCFNPFKSDIDLIIVINSTISDYTKLDFMNHLIEFNKYAPSKGIELSIVKIEYTKQFIYPTPYELHFSNDYLNIFLNNKKLYIEKMKGLDKDLASHFMIIKNYGIILYGSSINEVFGDIKKEYYIDSILCDINSAKENIKNNPLYIILNLCRVLAYLKNELVLSKKDGVIWGLDNLPKEYHNLLNDAKKCYESNEEFHSNLDILEKFFSYMIMKIRECL